jgi:hypothetical protein
VSAMSIVQRMRGERAYLYFQYYENGRKMEVYLGPAENHDAWMRGRQRLVDYRNREMKEQIDVVDKKIAERLRLTHRRLLQSPEKIQSRERLAEDVESLASRPSAVALHPLLKDELEKLLRDLKKGKSLGGRNTE